MARKNRSAQVDPQTENTQTEAVEVPQTEAQTENATNGSKRGRKASQYPSLLTFKAQIKDIKNGAPVPAGLTVIPETRKPNGFVDRHQGYSTPVFPRVSNDLIQIVNLETSGYNLTPVVRLHRQFRWDGAALAEVPVDLESEVSEE